MTDSNPGARLAGVLLLSSLVAMVAAVALVVPSGLTLNPSEPGAALAAVRANVGLHLAELAFDVLGWLALTAAGLVVAAGGRGQSLAGGLLAAAGLAGLLHDAGNLALTQLESADAAGAVLLTAKWMVNLAGLLWVAATVAAAAGVPMPVWLRRAGVFAVVSGLVSVALPWTTGAGGPSVALEQLGYVLHAPIMVWYGVLGWRWLRGG
ncbi:hypothetical protein [Nonomuraea sp. SBT364]|uniref:hypothetical protein n=1 Tax=Nonomuraea sp. SBT364 TaxID=1580530 RepID=UPI00066E55E9|nr:hypothetical protein [Nonomuraea sp. SBT364]